MAEEDADQWRACRGPGRSSFQRRDPGFGVIDAGAGAVTKNPSQDPTSGIAPWLHRTTPHSRASSPSSRRNMAADSRRRRPRPATPAVNTHLTGRSSLNRPSPWPPTSAARRSTAGRRRPCSPIQSSTPRSTSPDQRAAAARPRPPLLAAERRNVGTRPACASAAAPATGSLAAGRSRRLHASTASGRRTRRRLTR